MIQIDVLLASNDDYIRLLRDATSRRYAVVDPGDAKPVEIWLVTHPDWRLSGTLVTHHHHDHVGGAAALKELTGMQVLGSANEKILTRDPVLEGGKRVEALSLAFEIFCMPGHTLGHIVYYHPAEMSLLFCGDALFAAGYGRLFEGTPMQMHRSLVRLAALSVSTRVYYTHKYVLSNLHSALVVELDNVALWERFEEIARLRGRDRITLPSEILLELSTSPFFRVSEDSIKKEADQRSGQQSCTLEEVFAVLRA